MENTKTIQTQWMYSSEYSYEANMNNWIDAVNFERRGHNETLLTKDQGVMKFHEIYPKGDFS